MPAKGTLKIRDDWNNSPDRSRTARVSGGASTAKHTELWSYLAVLIELQIVLQGVLQSCCSVLEIKQIKIWGYHQPLETQIYKGSKCNHNTYGDSAVVNNCNNETSELGFKWERDRDRENENIIIGRSRRHRKWVKSFTVLES